MPPADWFQALVLGMVQGVTEFLPISSSGHLVIVPALLRWDAPSLSFAVALHWGTLLSVLWAFRRDLKRMAQDMGRSARLRRLVSYEARDGFFLLLASLPAAGVGYGLRPWLAEAMDGPFFAALGLCATALLLGGSELVGRWRERRRYIEEMTWWDALLMGLGQALALAPGISRSGATMAMGRLRLLDRPGAARFSFLMGIPVMLGAGFLETLVSWQDGAWHNGFLDANAWIGVAASALCGLAAIKVLLGYVRRRSFMPFALYCLAVGLGLALYWMPQGLG